MSYEHQYIPKMSQPARLVRLWGDFMVIFWLSKMFTNIYLCTEQIIKMQMFKCGI